MVAGLRTVAPGPPHRVAPPRAGFATASRPRSTELQAPTGSFTGWSGPWRVLNNNIPPFYADVHAGFSLMMKVDWGSDL